jgi:hypothetical protein
MKQKISITLLAALVVANVGFASPLTDYSQNKVAIEIGFQSPQISENYHDADGTSAAMPDADGKSTANLGITAGLGNRFAIQYKNFSPKSKTTNYLDITTFNTKVKVNEYNLLYQLNHNVAAFTGIAQVKATQTTSGNADIEGGSIGTQKKNSWQIGLVGSIPLAEKTTAYATAGFGSKLTAYKLGVSYAVASNLELDAFYGYNKYKDLAWEGEYSNNHSDFTVKGAGYGITYKF